ncbi:MULTISPECIES: hypothetical protein [unclassified Plantactinospora]|uniref:hypothetical protein n=1 Tax=unclassified Plantactinospora TaxID=2631981 RepID=UPI00131F22E4|nr:MULTISPECIES: hypothetical protein [unclassified Plantactinospora]
MTRMHRGGAVLAAVVALVVLTGCQSLGGGGESGAAPAEPTAMRGATDAVKQARTLRATFKTRQSGGTIAGGTITGEAQVMAGSGMAVTWSYRTSTGSGEPRTIDGRLVAVDTSAYLTSSQWKLPEGKKWFSVPAGWRATLDQPIAPEWFVLVMSRLLDPLFLLDQGLPEATGLEATPAPGEPEGTTGYTVDWNFSLDSAGPQMAAWAKQVGEAVVLEVSLYLDGSGRPVRLKVGSSTQLMLFDTEVTFASYGTPAEVAPPAPAQVEKI